MFAILNSFIVNSAPSKTPVVFSGMSVPISMLVSMMSMLGVGGVIDPSGVYVFVFFCRC